jgi:hypothetical protein
MLPETMHSVFTYEASLAQTISFLHYDFSDLSINSLRCTEDLEQSQNPAPPSEPARKKRKRTHKNSFPDLRDLTVDPNGIITREFGTLVVSVYLAYMLIMLASHDFRKALGITQRKASAHAALLHNVVPMNATEVSWIWEDKLRYYNRRAVAILQALIPISRAACKAILTWQGVGKGQSWMETISWD